MEQRCRHDEELAREIDIGLRHQVQILEIAVAYLRDRNVVDVDLIATNEVEKKIERSLEHRQPDAIVLFIAFLCIALFCKSAEDFV